jgi:hypothetical protein
MGFLYERLSEHHAAYRCYRMALSIDSHDPIARPGLRRYCKRFGVDTQNKLVNPAREWSRAVRASMPQVDPGTIRPRGDRLGRAIGKKVP